LRGGRAAGVVRIPDRTIWKVAASRQRQRQQPRIGTPDAALTANAGLAAISELRDRLGVIEALDAAVGPIKQRDLTRSRARGGSSSCGAAGHLAADA
jgi:hypothetical protein